MPATANRPATADHHHDRAEADSTGNQASDLSDRSTAHERFAISHEIWNRLMASRYSARRSRG